MSFTPQWHLNQPHRKWRLLWHQKRFLVWSMYCSVGGLMLGYDVVVASTVSAYPAFQKQMGIPYPSRPSGYLIPANRLSGFTACSTAGDIVGNLCSGDIMVRYGREPVLLVAALIAAIGGDGEAVTAVRRNLGLLAGLRSATRATASPGGDGVDVAPSGETA